MTEYVNDKFSFAAGIGWRNFPELMREYREDVDQEIHFMMYKYPGQLEIHEWAHVVSHYLHKLARDYSIKRGRGDRSRFMKEKPFSRLMDDHEVDHEKAMNRIERLLNPVVVPEYEFLKDKAWYHDALSMCERILGADSEEWRILQAYLLGWSQEEISIAFEVEDAAKRIREIVRKIRTEAGVPTRLYVPMPEKKWLRPVLH